jgi:hypothetical protein
LAARLGQGPHGRSPLVVAVVAPGRSARGQVTQVQEALSAQATTSTIPVAGYLADDEKAVQGLRDGVVTKRLVGSDLLKSARGLTQTLTGWFPELGWPTKTFVTTPAGTGHDGTDGDQPVPRAPMTPVEQHQDRLGSRATTGPITGGGAR